MTWTVYFSTKAAKQVNKLTKINKNAVLSLQLLVEDLKSKGANPGAGWHNYGKLKGKKGVDRRHCHLLKGNPTYVCCWGVIDDEAKIIEVYYAGTHEKAPY